MIGDVGAVSGEAQLVQGEGNQTGEFDCPDNQTGEFDCCLCRKAGEVIAGFIGDTPLVFCERCYKSFEKEGRENLNVGDRVFLKFENGDCNPLKNRLVCWRLDGSGKEPFVVEVERVA